MTDTAQPARWPPPVSRRGRRHVRRILDRGPWTDGPWTREVEQRMCDLTGAPYAVAFPTCTAAVHATLAALPNVPGGTVAAPTFTFVGTWTGGAHLGATPHWLDARTDDHTPAAPTAVDDHTAAVLTVDLHGAPHRLPRRHFAARPVVTDACQSLGTLVHGQHLGRDGTHCWSFSAAKAVPAPAGGCATTDSAALAQQLHVLRDYGTPVHDPRPRACRPTVAVNGHHWRPTEVDMAIVASRLDEWHRWVPAMRQAGEQLRTVAQRCGFTVAQPASGAEVAWHKVRIGRPGVPVARLRHALTAAGVTSHRWGRPLHTMDAWWTPRLGRWPVAEWLAAETVCLGTEHLPHWTWRDREIRQVCAALELAAEQLDTIEGA